MIFAPGELAPVGFLYIIHRGFALYIGQMLTSGRVWGDDVLLHSAHLRLKHSARSLHYLWALSGARTRDSCTARHPRCYRPSRWSRNGL